MAQAHLDEMAIAAQYGLVEATPRLAESVQNSHQIEEEYFTFDNNSGRVAQDLEQNVAQLRSAAEARHEQTAALIDEVRQHLKEAS